MATAPDSMSPRTLERSPAPQPSGWRTSASGSGLRDGGLQDGVAQHGGDDVGPSGDGQQHQRGPQHVLDAEQARSARAPRSHGQNARHQPWRRTWATHPVVRAPSRAPAPGAAVEEAECDGASAEDGARHGREEGARHAEDHGIDIDDVDALQRLAAARGTATPPCGRLPGGEPRVFSGWDRLHEGGGDQCDDEGTGVECKHPRKSDAEGARPRAPDPRSCPPE